MREGEDSELVLCKDEETWREERLEMVFCASVSSAF
jgi:hypothetical protein